MTDRLVSQDGRYTLVVQNDRNVVLYERFGQPDQLAVWHSNTWIDGTNTVPPPVTPPTVTPPVANGRKGLSYYTSLTDPRVDPVDFAVRLSDAGCGQTRVWLIDAWAVSKDGGTGCYDGFMPWRVNIDGEFDLYDVSRKYLDALQYYVEAMNRRNVIPMLTGWELYSWSDRKQGMLWVPDASRGPFQNNVQDINYADDQAFNQIATRTGNHDFLENFYHEVVNTLSSLQYTVELGNEMPEKALHYRLRDAWRRAGYAGPIQVNRQDDTPGQFSNMKIGTDFDRIAFHGRRNLWYLDEDFADEPMYRTFRAFLDSGADLSRVTFSSDGCRKSTNPDDAYNYDSLREVFTDALERGCSIEHQSRMKLRGFTEGRIDLNDLEVEWMRSL